MSNIGPKIDESATIITYDNRCEDDISVSFNDDENLTCYDINRGALYSIPINYKSECFDSLQMCVFIKKTVSKDKKSVLPKNMMTLILFYMLKPTPLFHEPDIQKIIAFEDIVVSKDLSKANKSLIVGRSYISSRFLMYIQLGTGEQSQMPCSNDYSAIFVSESREFVVYSDTVCNLRLWNVKKRMVERELVPSEYKRVKAICMSGNDNMVFTVMNGISPVVMAWDRRSSTSMCKYSQRMHMEGNAMAIACSYTGTVAVVRFIKSVGLWKNGKINTHRFREDSTTFPIYLITMSRCGKLFAFTESDGKKIILMDTNFCQHKRFKVNGPKKLAFSPDGARLLCVDKDRIHLFEIPKCHFPL